MRGRRVILVWIVGLAIGIVAGALAALLLIPNVGSNASGNAAVSAPAVDQSP